MATGVLICPRVFSRLKEEQVLTWRTLTYKRPGEYMQFTESEMLSMKPTSTLTLDQIRESIRERMIKHAVTGGLQQKESVFVMIDSSTLGATKLTSAISSLKNKYDLANKNLILVVSQINLTENIYKFQNKDKYRDIHFDNLTYNLDLLFGYTQFKMNNIVLFHTDVLFDNKVLFEEEKRFLQGNRNRWLFKDRNEINDNAQLKMLILLNQMFSKECFLITRDKGLLNKVNKQTNKLHGFHF